MMKKKLVKLMRYCLMLFTYPKELAEAVNRVASPEELDEYVMEARR